MSEEIWKPILGYEDYYEVSNLGRVKRIKYGQGVRPYNILTLQMNTTKYLQIFLTVNGKSKSHKVHKLVAEAFLGPRPSGLDINHRNGIRTDNRIENLEYVTRSENERHAYDVLGKKCASGEAAGNTRYTEKDVKNIRRRYLQGEKKSDLAREYGMSHNNITSIIIRRTWKDVE